MTLIVFVSKKIDEKKLLAQQLEPIPKQFKGITTDVIEIRFVPRNGKPDDNMYRLITGGIAINRPSPYVGTLGIIINKIRSSIMYGITNNHIGAGEDLRGLDPASAVKGDPWFQPASKRSGNVIARLDGWNKLKPHALGNINYYDFALGEIVDEIAEKARPYEILDIGRVIGIESET